MMRGISAISGAIALMFVLLVARPASAHASYLTGETGHRVGTNQHSQTVGRNGPILLQDVYTLEKMRRFNTERIPERVVHARGVGAHGVFKSAANFSNLTAAHFLSHAGISTELFVRFSTVIHGKQSPETLRDPRGFAIKFKTERDGNWDLVGNNLPVFFIRDHIKFPDMVHSLKPDPITNIQDPNRFFDFFASIGGSATHMLTYLYSDLGIPKSYRFMDGNGIHAYKMVNSTGHFKYVKFQHRSQQGVHNLTVDQASEMQGKDFSHATRDLYDAIKRGDFPKWDLMVQIMNEEQLDDFEFNPLDATKEWPEEDFPLTMLGTFELNRVPHNFHLTSEQSAFSPGNFLPGMIEPSEDRLLQGRLISYHESQTHRHGSNVFQHLAINRPNTRVRNYNQEGVMAMDHAWNGSVNYEPSFDDHSYKEDQQYRYSQGSACSRYVQKAISKTLDFKQAGQTYRSFSPPDQRNLVSNLGGDLKQVRRMDIRNTMCAHFYKADRDYGMALAEAVQCNMNVVRDIARSLQG